MAQQLSRMDMIALIKSFYGDVDNSKFSSKTDDILKKMLMRIENLEDGEMMPTIESLDEAEDDIDDDENDEEGSVGSLVDFIVDEEDDDENHDDQENDGRKTELEELSEFDSKWGIGNESSYKVTGSVRKSTRTKKAPLRFTEEYAEDISKAMLFDIPAEELHAALGLVSDESEAEAERVDNSEEDDGEYDEDDSETSSSECSNESEDEFEDEIEEEPQSKKLKLFTPDGMQI